MFVACLSDAPHPPKAMGCPTAPSVANRDYVLAAPSDLYNFWKKEKMADGKPKIAKGRPPEEPTTVAAATTTFSSELNKPIQPPVGGVKMLLGGPCKHDTKKPAKNNKKRKKTQIIHTRKKERQKRKTSTKGNSLKRAEKERKGKDG